MKHTEFDKRMKKYEQTSKTVLVSRMPVIIRIDGKAFHTFTKKFKKPFDDILIKTMQETTKYLCENIQGCVLGYTQSDEITLVLVDYKSLDTDNWFDNEVQKICSISASMATMKFNKIFEKYVEEFYRENTKLVVTENESNIVFNSEENKNLYENYLKAIEKGAMFDSRCFNIPKEEVCNNIYWREQDAIRNSIQMVAHTLFTNKELHKKNTTELKEMLLTKNFDFDKLETFKQRGTCIIKKPITLTRENGDTFERNKWVIDKNIPIFIGDDRNYIENLIFI